MDELKKLAQSFVQAAQIAGPTSYIPEITKFAQAGAIAPIVKQAQQAAGGFASQKGQEADQADEAARKAKIAELQNQADPSKYQKVRKTDGGFQFLDPSGKEIDINTFAQRTGQRRVDILKDSENPIDQQYINDWSNANDLAQAFYNGDQATQKAFVDQNPELKGRTPADFMSELIKKYPHMYGRGTYQQTVQNRGSGPAFGNNPNYVGGGVAAGGSAGGWRPN